MIKLIKINYILLLIYKQIIPKYQMKPLIN